MRVICQCVSLTRQAETRYGDGGPVVEERVTVVLEPVYSLDPGHPNRGIWRGVAFGQLRLAELPPAAASLYKLHGLYAVELTALEEG